MEQSYELVFCVINAGFSETVMTAARKAGAGGGTILKGRGTAGRAAEELFNIKIQPEKEIVMLLVPAEIKDAVLRSIYDSAGLDRESHGIAFTLPVERTLGLNQAPAKEAAPEEKKTSKLNRTSKNGQ